MDVMADALRALARGDATMPLRTVIRLPDGKSAFALMPAVMREPASFGVKAITVFPENEGTAYDSHQGAVLLFDNTHGTIVALLDATAITGIRTAAISGLATRLLARDDATTLALIGSGVQAWTHLEAMMIARPVSEVRVWSRTPANAAAFVARAVKRHRIDIRVSASAQEAVRGADIICTVTSSRVPVVEGAWLANGAHLNVVGASLPTAREVDATAVRRARLYVDRRESALNEAGDILVPLREGAIDATHIVAELGEVLLDPAKGRRSKDEITLFKSLGLAIEDLAAASRVYARALERGVGTRVDLGGVRHAAS
jgi:ornithine cyclodeaminase